MSTQETSELVLRKSVTVARPAEEAFRLFTEGMATWWPLLTHSVAEADAETVEFECRQGGRIVERTKAGDEHVWGTVLVWEPFTRIVHSWHPGRGDETGQRVELTFEPAGNGTRVELVHTGWEQLGERGRRMYENYDGGWDYVFVACFGGAAR